MKNLNEYRHVHFIGIGGISMSALAFEVHKTGAVVSGSDSALSHITEKLSAIGIKVSAGHCKENLDGADLVVKNSAIKPDNPELQAAIESGAEIIDRAALLGLLMSRYRRRVAVSGMHGKTTTTGLVASVLAPLKPAIHIGGELIAPKGGLEQVTPTEGETGNSDGGTDIFITEACEYCRNFLHLEPDTAIVLNIDDDHMDYFKDTDDIICAFDEFAHKIRDGGQLVYNGDDKNCRRLTPQAQKVSVGLNPENDYYAAGINSSAGRYSFDIYGKGGKYIERVSLGIFGRHQIYNALAAFAVGQLYDLPSAEIKRGLENFGGVKRRFELYGKKLGGADVIIDYAHHPREITALLRTAGEAGYGKIFCVFQPHTYTRTEALLEEFAACFEGADTLVLMPVYAAREKAGAVTSLTLLEKIKKTPLDCIHIESGAEVIEYLKTRAGKGDVVLITGAGNIVDICKLI